MVYHILHLMFHEVIEQLASILLGLRSPSCDDIIFYRVRYIFKINQVAITLKITGNIHVYMIVEVVQG